MKILIVDDEKLLVKGIKYNLEQDGYECEAAYDGEEAVNMAQQTNYDLIILDLMLPVVDGLEACQKIREFSSVPIMMLTAKSDDMDKILGLEYGADDYLTKPFNVLELKARVKAILRRSAITKKAAAAQEEPQKESAVVINYDLRRAAVDGRIIELTSKEFDLLVLFTKNPNKVYSRDELLNIVWGYEYAGDVRTVDVHVKRLRNKIESDPANPKYLHTKWGVGYYFSE